MKEKTTQEALKELEKIVADLSAKDVDVDEGLKKFKEGVELITFCRGQLKKSENEFKKLRTELEDGEAAEESKE